MSFFRSRFLGLLSVLVLVLIFSGCAKKIKTGASPVFENLKPKQIAVLPVINKAGEADAAAILREKTINELYDKGYARIVSKAVDDKLSRYYKEGSLISPQVVGDLLKVDTVLYCTLSEWKRSVVLAYGVISVRAEFVLRSAKNGEVLWKGNKVIERRSLHPLKKEIHELILLDYEPAIHDLVHAALDSLPNGPNFVAHAPVERFYEGWF
jgi:hypothetical protein